MVKNIIKNIFNNKQDSMLNQFNHNVSYVPVTYSKQNNRGKSFNILILGNSISLHGEAPELGWFNNCGMAATSLEKDYIHILLDLLQEYKKGYDFYCDVLNLADFERYYSEFNLENLEKILSINKYNTVIFQLGDNVENKKINKRKFITQYNKLINMFNNAYKFITIPFFNSPIKQKLIEHISKINNAIIVDLSKINALKCSTDGFYSYRGGGRTASV